MMNNSDDKMIFHKLCQKHRELTKERVSIGLLKEKTLHAVLKDFALDDNSYHEIKIGKFIVDVFNGESITEIQTANFRSLYKKLVFLLETHNVTVVHPISQTKWIYWVDPETGAVDKPHKSTICGSFPHALHELYGVKDLLNHDNLTVKLLLLETEEYRIRNGYGKNKTKRATKVDIFPLRLIESLSINSSNDLKLLIPKNLPETFTTAQFNKLGKFYSRKGAYAKRLLAENNLIHECGKCGRATLWAITDTEKTL